MGGRGSGRSASFGFGVDKVEDYRQIDLGWLKRTGSLDVGYRGRITWSRGGTETGSICYRIETSGLRLVYRTRPRGRDTWTDVDELVPFAYTSANYGGRRRWFVCLGCRRRCRVLYGGSYYRCRQCYGLRYGSQYEERSSRAISQVHRLRERLGQRGSLDDAFPPKPKGMHWRTYRRLEARDEALQMRWAEAIRDWLKRMKPGE